MNKHIGSTFESWLERRGLRERVHTLSAKKIIAREIASAMEARKVNKSALARMMETDRPAIHRLLDPNEPGLTLTTIIKAMHVLEIPTLTIVGAAAFAAPSKGVPSKAAPRRKIKALAPQPPQLATVHALPAKKAATFDHQGEEPEGYEAVLKRRMSRRGRDKGTPEKKEPMVLSGRMKRRTGR